VNTDPIYSRVGVIAGGCTLVAAANDYTGASINNQLAFVADATNGGFLKRLRFKALGTNVASVARVYFVRALSDNLVTTLTAPAGTPTGTPSGSGGTLQTGNYFAKIYAVDKYGKMTAASTETASVAVTGPTGSISWAWTASTGATSYVIAVGQVTNGQRYYFTSTTNSYTQTDSIGTVASPFNAKAAPTFYGEVSLPATTATATAATPDIDYAINEALGPGDQVYVGLGTAVAAGWAVTPIAGAY
jgi:hypothetical protein